MENLPVKNMGRNDQANQDIIEMSMKRWDIHVA